MSAAGNCLVIGEDLGTIPGNFRETLADWGIWSYQVMQFSLQHEITGSAAWTAAFVLMALSMVVARTAVVAVRAA